MNRGFTLIEIAIVLVLLGLLIGIGASLIGPLTKRTKYTETKETLNGNVESIIGYAATLNCIPQTSNLVEVIRNTKDSWGKDFLYIPANELNGTNCSSEAGICQRKSTSLVVRKCQDSSCTTYNDTNDVAFVMISGGLNYNIQTASDSSNIVKIYGPGTPDVDDYNGDFLRVEEYDDIVKWITLGELKIKIGCEGKPLKILNNELPVGYENQTYSAQIYAEGGIPYSSGGKYEWCREGSLPPGITSGINVCPSWTKSDNVNLSGTPSTHGTFLITFKVKDNDNNTAEKNFVITIHPSP